LSNLRRLLASREVVALLATAFTADVISGIIFPSFSLYAQSLGASLALIGALSATGGITQMLAGVPMGILADKRGHRNVLLVGMALFAISSFLYTIVPNPYLLLGVRVLAGLASVSVFFVGLAYLGDVTRPRERGLAVGLWSTVQGIGFTVGPVIGGAVAAAYGHGASFRMAAVIGLVGFVALRQGLRQAAATSTRPSRRATGGGSWAKAIVHRPILLGATLGNLLGQMVFGIVFSFFPIYAVSVSMGEASVGAIFSLRAFASAASRLPTGLLTTRIPSQYLLLASLVVDMAAMLALSWADLPLVLGLLVALEGLAYGVLLTAGQSCVTEHSPEGDRATVVGFYSGAGSIGSAAGSLAMGVVAQVWGLPMVFRATGVLVGIGIAVLLWAALRREE
jgi:MFS family permease